MAGSNDDYSDNGSVPLNDRQCKVSLPSARSAMPAVTEDALPKLAVSHHAPFPANLQHSCGGRPPCCMPNVSSGIPVPCVLCSKQRHTAGSCMVPTDTHSHFRHLQVDGCASLLAREKVFYKRARCCSYHARQPQVTSMHLRALTQHRQGATGATS